jgi:signal transduction histidine kinase/CheY-like chemotaxis protein
VFYVANENEEGPSLDLVATYGAEKRGELKERFDLREGLIGQAAADKRPMRLNQVPGDFIKIGTGLGAAAPANINILPALFEDEVKAVIELASFEEFNETHHTFLTQLMETVGIVLNTIAATMRTEELLKESQLLTQELQSRQTELTTKQEELHATNEELQEKAQLLENEKKQVEAKNFEIDMARRAVEEKAEQLALTSKYKSEFLANMSHELRTPLNSLLILSKMLADNQQGNLNEKQTEFARTIHSAGTDLLSLINDILDLSKIESGTVAIEIGDMSLASLKQHMERTFRQVALEKSLQFEVDFDDDLPATIRTDEKRLQQIVLNLLSNAFKFTADGGVTLAVRLAQGGWSASHPVLAEGEYAVQIEVTDTGIGIPEDKQRLIFEAFQQADGTTSRKYGGTGLGLSISREIASLLGGEIQVRSTVGQGSTFTFYVPLRAPGVAPALALPAAIQPDAPADALIERRIEDDRDDLGDQAFVLIVEDDPTFAGVLLDVAHDCSLKGVISSAGSGTLAMVRKMRPSAITLDLGLSDIDGFVLLDLLRHDPESRDIPVYVISGAEQAAHALTLGASQVIEKPASRDELRELFGSIGSKLPATGKRKRRKRSEEDFSGRQAELAGTDILIVDDDIRNIYSLASVLEAHGANVLHAERGAEGLALLEQNPTISVALIDIMMPEMDGYETMGRIRSEAALAHIPLIAVTAKAMKGDRQKCLDAGASDYIAKPVDIDLLLALLRVWIGRSKSEADSNLVTRVQSAA